MQCTVIGQIGLLQFSSILRSYMKETSLNEAAKSDFVELTAEEIRQINGAAETAAAATGGLYPEISNDPP